MNRLFFSAFFLIVFAFGLPGFPRQLQATICPEPGWPSQRSELAPDPTLVGGELANGLRYAVMENREPADHVALFLYVGGGSLHETEGQRGIAHFLEHMLFHGTTHFAPGELIGYLQDIGMGFGRDTNAHTSYDETVYRLDLPRGDDESLHKGMLVMADYARGALLLESEVERERGVILAEKRSRESAVQRARSAATAQKFAGTLLPDREVIGTTEVLLRADARVLRDYYEQWYRPENMVLVAVGDASSATLVGLIEKYFAPLTGAGKKPQCPDPGDIAEGGVKTFGYYDPELAGTHVSIESFANIVPRDDSKEVRREELISYLIDVILNNRLRKLQESQGDIFTGAGYSSGELLSRYRYASLSASTETSQWQPVLEELNGILRQALQYGVLGQELEEAKENIRSSLNAAVLTVASRKSESIGREIIRQFTRNRVVLSPAQKSDLYSAILNTIDLAAVHEQLVRDWSGGRRVVGVTGNVRPEAGDGEAAILKAYTDSGQKQVERYRGDTVPVFPYLEIGKKENRSVNRQQLSTVGGVRLDFANKVSVLLKPTTFEPNRVVVAARIGRGKMTEPLPGLAELGEDVINGSGTSRLEPSEMARALAGTTVNVRFQIGEESSVYLGSSVSADAERLLQVITHLLEDPGLSEQAWKRTVRRMEQVDEHLRRDVEGLVESRIDRFLAGGDQRAGWPAMEEVRKRTIEELRSWLVPEITDGSLEVALVGDFAITEMENLVSRYFGGLSERKKNVPEFGSRQFPQEKLLELQAESDVQKSLVVVTWPTTGFWDIGKTRRLNILAAILLDKMRQVIREEMGASYSPVVIHLPERAYPDYGRMQVQVVVEPGNETAVRQRIGQLIADLRERGVEPIALERAKKPVLTELYEAVRTNSYWLNSVLAGGVRYPVQLQWPQAMIDDYTRITKEDMDSLISTYLDPDTMITVFVRPVGTTMADRADEAGSGVEVVP